MKIVPLWDSGKWCCRYLLQFTRGYSVELYTLVWANSLESALDEAIDWIAEHEPSLTCNSEVHAEYNRLVAEGVSHEQAIEESEADTYVTDCGNYIDADSWGIVFEDPADDDLFEFLGAGLDSGKLTQAQYDQVEDAINDTEAA